MPSAVFHIYVFHLFLLCLCVCVVVVHRLNRLVQQHQEMEKRLQELEKQKQQQPPQQPGQRNLPPTPDQQRLIAEINALKQRLQETGARSENEVEQWRKVVEQEKVKCTHLHVYCNEKNREGKKYYFEAEGR